MSRCQWVGGSPFVALAAVTEATLVGGASAAMIGLPDAGDRPLTARLHDALGDQRALLLLDNFEQVLDAAPIEGELLVACRFYR